MESSNLSYPEELFESIANGFNTIFTELKNQYSNITLNGIWPFLYYEGSNSLKSIYPVFIEKNIENNLSVDDKDELKKTSINCDYGSIGFAFKSIRNNTEPNYDKLYKTYNEPRGVVCYLDSKIKQEHAVFIAIRGSNNKILGLLDLFFNGDIEEKIFSTFAKNLYLKFDDDLLLKRLCINSFIIQQFYKLQQQSAFEFFDTNPIKRIEDILALSGHTPVFYFSYQNQVCTHEYLGLNFELLNGFIAHEYRFCGLVKRDIKCYYKNQTTNEDLSCENSLLKNYYYDVIKEGNLLSFSKEFNISEIDSKYIVKIIAKENELDTIETNCFSSFKDELANFNQYKELSDVAKNKFTDEIVFSTLKKISSNASVLILYREVKGPYLIYSGNCCDKQLEIKNKNKLKYFISPSELMHYKFSSEESAEPLLGRAKSKDEKEKWDVVGFEILNKELFIKSLKRKIADSPELYCQSIIPYMDNETTDEYLKVSNNINQYKNLRLHFIGKDPTSGEDYIPIINEQISKIYGEFKTKEALKHATRAAISQLYARTDAHDLGHVLDALKTLKDIFSDETTKTQYDNSSHKTDNSLYNELIDIIAEFEINNEQDNDRSKINYKFYPKLIGYFIKFLKERMDFRADVATCDPNSLTTLDFYSDVFLPFNNNLIFNNRISGINDKNLLYSFVIKNNNVKIPVAIPNDVLGCHALYIIFSNIIRNTVKHGDVPSDGKIVFTIEIEEFEKNKEFYELKIYSNYIKKQITEEIKNKINDIKNATDKTDTKKKDELNAFTDYADIDDLVKKRNETFNETILNTETNRLRDSSLGSIEMDTCAAYLRKLPVTAVEDDDFDLFEGDKLVSSKVINGKNIPKLLYAYAQKHNNEEETFSLGYKFYLLKPKEILIVSDDPENSKKSLFKKDGNIDFEKEGILFVKPEQLKNGTYDHRFLMFLGNDDGLKKLLEENKEHLSAIPKRQVAIESSEFKNIPCLKNTCWEKWNKGFNIEIKINFYNFDHEFNINSNNSKLECCLHEHAQNLETCSLFDEQYHEMICGHHWAKQKITPLFDNAKNTVWMQYYIDSILSNVLIIDERIQKNIVLQGKLYGNKIPFSFYFENIGVFIPSPAIADNLSRSFLPSGSKDKYEREHNDDPNLNSKLLSEEKEKIKIYITKYAEKARFIVIHLGILEKVLSNTSEKKNPEIINNIINEVVPDENNRQKLIITSGRGKPNNLSQTYSYVPISLIQNAIETTFDKYRLVQILYNSRKSI